MNRNLIYCLTFLLLIVGFSSCSKEYSSETGAFTTARGSLHDNSGNCFTSNVVGNYATGVTLTAAHYVELQVNVTTPGNYTISSDTLNGFFFQDAGIFSSTGVKTIMLKASGMPLISQNTNFLVSFDSTVCTFAVAVTDSSGNSGSINDSDTAWQFTEGSKNFHGFIYDASTIDTLYQGQSLKVLQIQGATAAAADSVFFIAVTFPGGVITPGNYSTNTFSVFKFLGSYDFNDTVYSADPFIPTVTTTVRIATYNSLTQIVQGTISGTAKNKAGNNVTISQGRFYAKLN